MTAEVYIVDGARTPFLKARGKPGQFSASDLAVKASRALLARQPFMPTELDEVVVGSTMPSPDEANIGRVVSLRLGCGKSVPAWTVMRNCASGMQALDSAVKDVACGRHNLVLAGGTDAMSHAPLLFNKRMVNWLAAWMGAKKPAQRVALLPKLRPAFFAPVIALLRGLTDPSTGLSMGQTAEELAYEFGITRHDMDEFAVKSHLKAVASQDKGLFDEIVTIYDNKGNFYQKDDGVRADSNVEKLGTLRPFFDKKFGNVTAANSSQVTDGAAFVILASKEAVEKHNLPVMAKITDTEWAGLAPAQMGLGPIHASTPILQRQGLGLNDIDFWEINEAFAAQVIGCLRAWENDTYCQQELGLDKALGSIDPERLNVDGGAIAQGHPVGATGARLVLHICHLLKRNNAKRGMATLCIGGGQGGAMLIENVNGVQ